MYRNQAKNFFYDITVSTPDGKKTARLTDTLLKLCTQADIMEAVASEEGDGASSLTLTFIEADFLPDDLDKSPVEGVSGRGYITNRTGALIDLRFDSEKGFTYVTPQELQSGLTQSSRTKSNKTEEVAFLFSTNNIVDITWGHLEPRASRSRRFKIGTVSYSTGAGGNTMTLQCFNLQKELARIKLSEGKTWVSKEGEPLSLKQCVHTIARVFGARLVFDGADITDKEMENYIPPSKYEYERTKLGGDTRISTNGTPLYLLRSQSIDFWLKDLARDFNSTYEIFEDPLDVGKGIPVIKFTAKAIRFKKVMKTLNYRDPNGIMLEFQFNTIAGEVSKETNVSAVSENGKAESEILEPELTDGTNRGTAPAKTFEGIPLIFRDRAQIILERDLVGTSMTAPATSQSSVEGKAQSGIQNTSFMGFITVKTIGHPDFQPDVMDIQGVGVRASTTYRFFQVQHSLSSAGYICTMQGKTQESIDQGVSNTEQLKSNSEYNIVPLQTPQGQ
jgi:hypothetical protein